MIDRDVSAYLERAGADTLHNLKLGLGCRYTETELRAALKRLRCTTRTSANSWPTMRWPRDAEYCGGLLGGPFVSTRKFTTYQLPGRA